MALSTGLTHYWSLEENGGTRYDSRGAKNFTEYGSTPRTTGKINYALDIVGNQTDYLGAGSALCTDDTFSWNCWVYNTVTVTTPVRCIWSKPDNAQFAISWSNPYFHLAVTGSPYQIILQDTSGFSNNTWYMYTLTRDATSGNTYMYKNGNTTPVASDTGHTNAMKGTSGNLEIGRRVSSFDGIDGRLDELSYWDRVLTPAEVEELYNGGAGLSYSDIVGTEIAGAAIGPAPSLVSGLSRFWSVPGAPTGPTATVASQMRTLRISPGTPIGPNPSLLSVAMSRVGAPTIQEDMVFDREQHQQPYFDRKDADADA